MTLKELNDLMAGNPERCWWIFDSVEDMNKPQRGKIEIWTQVSNGRGGFYEKWDDNPIINKEVVIFRNSGWQANVYYVVIK